MNNATRWPGYGRTSGMRCVITRTEPSQQMRRDRACSGKPVRSKRHLSHPWPLGPRQPGSGTFFSSDRLPCALSLFIADRFSVPVVYQQRPYCSNLSLIRPSKTTEPPHGRLCIYLSGVRVTRFWPIVHSTLIPLPARISDDLPDHRAHLPHNSRSWMRFYPQINSRHEHAVSVRRGLLF